jgi:hypothetical protein
LLCAELSYFDWEQKRSSSENRFEGWVEEVDSGKELRFHSTGELIQFLGERFRAAFQSRLKEVDQWRASGSCEEEKS